jgi:5,10-methylene-tetrahydrofolate dehydrogenase/methenyl tetrahydrofolate cyclohydrolase
MLDQILTFIFYILLAAVIIFALSKYFSGSRYRGLKPNLWGKVAVITGGNTGIGKETALALAQQGCKVIIGARDTKKSKAVVEEVNKLLGQAMIN